MHMQILLLLELLLLFVALPLGIAFTDSVHLLLPILWILGALCAFQLWRTYRISWKEEWRFGAIDKSFWREMLPRFAYCAVLLAFVIHAYMPERFLEFPSERPRVWLMVMLLYPILSAIPQEIIFRSWFFKRYAGLFSTQRGMRLASAVAFGCAHLMLVNPVAVGLSMIGGYFFAETYEKKRSLAAAWIEHSLYGCAIFTLGLGFYFYHGNWAVLHK